MSLSVEAIGIPRRRGLGQQHWHLLDSRALKGKPSMSLMQAVAARGDSLPVPADRDTFKARFLKAVVAKA